MTSTTPLNFVCVSCSRSASVDNVKSQARGLCHSCYSAAKREGRLGGKHCIFTECGKIAYSETLCQGHYVQFQKGQPLKPLRHKSKSVRPQKDETWRDFSIRYLDENSTYDPITKCIVWTGPLKGNGYGRARIDKRAWGAHRLAYALYHGAMSAEHADEILNKGVIHHTNAIRLSIDPRFLQLVSQHENSAEMLERVSYLKEIERLTKELAEANEGLSLLQSKLREYERPLDSP